MGKEDQNLANEGTSSSDSFSSLSDWTLLVIFAVVLLGQPFPLFLLFISFTNFVARVIYSVDEKQY